MNRLIVFVFALLSAVSVHASSLVTINGANGASLYVACAQSTTIGSGTYTFNNSTPGPCGVVPPPPANRLVNVTVAYPPNLSNRVTRSAQEWNAIFGHRTTSDAEIPFAGWAGSNVYLTNVTPTTYIALHFINNKPSTFAGTLKSPSNYAGMVFEASISTAAGDFSAPVGACHKLGVQPTDAVFITYTNAPGNAYRCQLPAEGYLNLRASGAGNTLHIINNHN